MSSPDVDPALRREDIDLTNCDREPIHIPGRVQHFGFLIAVTSDWIVSHVSRNAGDMLGIDGEIRTGMPLGDLFDRDAIHDMRTQLQMLSGPDSVGRLFDLHLGIDGGPFDVAIHVSGRSIVIEGERCAANRRTDPSSYVKPMVERMKGAKDLKGLCDIAVRQVKALTDYDRVMVYRFGADDSGEVIAEACMPGMEPYLGLRYPASDIPRQARALYERNLLRVIADVDDEGAEIVPVLSPEGQPLDLSMSTTRAVSPIHLEYLRNMGVRASMSISILRRGKLWGLFACHHEIPMVPTYPVRTAAELFAQFFSFLLDQKQGDAERSATDRGRMLHDRLMVRLAENTSINDNFEAIIEAVAPVIPHDGAVGWIDGEFLSVGKTPTQEDFATLVPFLNTTAAGRLFSTNCLSRPFPMAQAFAERAAGALVLPVSRKPRDYIILFRQEVVQSVRWAGSPDKPVEAGPNGTRLTPRKSFEAWKQTLRHHCIDWTDEEMQTAESLRVTLMEVVLRMASASMFEQARSQEQQELLIAELNHRVRNILNLIKSLIKQSADGQDDIDAFTKVIGGRIHALARAHDQITRENWSTASLYDLIQTEAAAYLGDRQSRIRVTGPDAMLHPHAFSTMALVIHELLTNSAKYGALVDSLGNVTVSLEHGANGVLQIGWEETGGPPVIAPTRRGFGTTIIERSIPYELKGTAEVVYDPAGVRATFAVPADGIDRFETRRTRPVAASEAVARASVSLGNVLLVEDNMIISLDAESFLTELGAETVVTASSNRQAIREMDEKAFDFALLDVNLGMETSTPVAQRLSRDGIPFIFATGYGEMRELNELFPDTPMVQKPYDCESLARAIAKI